MILALSHSFGVLPKVIIRLKSFVMANKTASGLSFQHSYVILEGPAALLFGKLLIELKKFLCSIQVEKCSVMQACEKAYSFSTATGNLRSHLHSKHRL